MERERAELERVRTELQQQVARAEAGRAAAIEEAERASLRDHKNQRCDRTESRVYSVAITGGTQSDLQGSGQQSLFHRWIKSDPAAVDAPG